MDFSTR